MRVPATALAAFALALSLGACDRATKPEPTPHASAPITEGRPDPVAPAAQPAPQPAPTARPAADGDAGVAGSAPARPPPGAAAGQAVRYTVRDSGVRCMAAPCPTYLAVRADAAPGEDALRVHELELGALGLSQEAQARVLEATLHGGVQVEARVETRKDAGPAGDATVLRVTRLLSKH